VLLAVAMFVLVVDTSLMNVSISSVVRDLGTTVSGVEAAIALEALVSAAFILIGGVNSAAGSFGLSFGLAFAGAIMLATLSFAFTRMADNSTVLAPAEKERVAQVLDHDAEVMSNT
jgi:hypothetical protein